MTENSEKRWRRTDEFVCASHPDKHKTTIEICQRCGRKERCETLKVALRRLGSPKTAVDLAPGPNSTAQTGPLAKNTVTKGKTGTSTSNFGVSGRESHDSTAFYARFKAPEISTDDNVEPFASANQIFCEDCREMPEIPPDSIALVVTSPPYFVGKEYEEALGQGHVPGSYVEYLEMLRDVFAECKRVLEPGGRIAVNVANLGRKPYRSLSADVIGILQDDLGLLLRAEIIWVKAEGASGSCAWGSFASAANPTLRDLTERVIVASKGRFDRAPAGKKREELGLPFENTITKEEFMAATLDTWKIPPASAKKIGHPAPFPVELPRRLIELYTFAGDIVLDPFLGSGTTAVAAVETGRRYVGYDTDPKYVELARGRLEALDIADTEPARKQHEAAEEEQEVQR